MILDGVSFFLCDRQKRFSVFFYVILIFYFLFCHTDFLYFYNNMFLLYFYNNMFLLAFYNKGNLL